MAKTPWRGFAALQQVVRTALLVGAVLVGGAPRAESGPAEAGSAAAAASAARPSSVPEPIRVPRVLGRLGARELGLVINDADPYSVAVGGHYQKLRQLAPEQVLHVELPVQARLSVADFERLRERIGTQFGPEIQALAFAWRQPYAVNCMSITGALAFGLDEALCRQTCGRAGASVYFNSASSRPFRDHGLRPSMLLAAGSIESALRLVERGLAADASLGLRGALPVQAWYVATTDAARNVRAALFPPAGPLRGVGVDVNRGTGDVPREGRRVVLVQTGLAHLPAELGAIDWVPGALADHLTSFGGALDAVSGQTPATAWIDAGATASYGTVSEPCNHLQKFPHPQVLLLHYLQGSTALEAYWKSVAWPQQGVFIGDPLAAPFARR